MIALRSELVQKEGARTKDWDEQGSMKSEMKELKKRGGSRTLSQPATRRRS